MLAGESKTAVETIDTQAKRHSLARSDIVELVGSKMSVMPDGFDKMKFAAGRSGTIPGENKCRSRLIAWIWIQNVNPSKNLHVYTV